MNRNAVLLALLAIGFALVNMGRRSEPGNGDGGDGDGQGVVATGATIANIAVNQDATMGRHRVPKVSGGNVQVFVDIQIDARNASGAPVAWLWRIETRIGHNTLFGWKRPDELPIENFGETGIRNPEFTFSPGLRRIGSVFKVPIDSDQTWDVRVKVEAAKSTGSGAVLRDSSGNVQWSKMTEGEHPGAFASVDDLITTTATITTIDARQDAASAPRRARL